MMYRRSVTAPAVRGVIAFMGALSLLLALFIHIESVPDSGYSAELVLISCGLFFLGVAYWQSRHVVIIDESGVRANIGRHKGFIPWDSVCEIGILSTSGGERIVYFAGERAVPYTGGAALNFHKPSNDVIKVGYNKQLLEAIERHYDGKIYGKKPAKGDAEK